MKYIIIPFAFFVILFSRCYYDSEENLYPNLSEGCDTTNVLFNSTIKPILATNCLSCHSNSTAAGFGNNIALENYSDVVAFKDPVLGAIRHDSPYSPMPKNGNKLNSCAIRQFEIWINNGTPEN